MFRKKAYDRRNQFEDLFMSNYRSFFQMGMRLSGQREFTKDVIQSFFVEVWEKQVWEKEVEYMTAYLHKAFYRKVLAEMKKQRRRAEVSMEESIELKIPSYEALLIELQQNEALQQRLNQAISQLPDQQRMVLNMRFQEGMNYDEIATQTGNSRQTIYNQIHAAVKKMRKNFREG
jgi:RNA polymerase sigma factor (sigma-70 family)